MKAPQLLAATRRATARAETKRPRLEAAARSVLRETIREAADRLQASATVHMTAGASGETDAEKARNRVQRAETRLSNAMESGDEARIQRAETELSNANEALDKALYASDDPGWTPPSDDELLPLDEIMSRYRTRTDPVRQAAVEDFFASFAASATHAGVNASWDVTNPVVADLLERLGSNVEGVSMTTRRNVRAVIARSYREGLSVQDTAAALRDLAPSIAETRAALIARTEFVGLTRGASVGATQIVSEATGTGYTKRWLTAPGAEYPRHEDYDDLDGQTVPLDGYFDVGGEPLAYPGDPDGEPAETCNCRCDLEYLEVGGE